ncbi:MAG: hypothetical protein IPP17_30365 [Bacteroidetes bacterium]|nr:hypothetical protein [Bacteroidota bacterium]
MDVTILAYQVIADYFDVIIVSIVVVVVWSTLCVAASDGWLGFTWNADPAFVLK